MRDEAGEMGTMEEEKAHNTEKRKTFLIIAFQRFFFFLKYRGRENFLFL